MSTITIKTDNQTLINILIGACSSISGTQVKVKNEPTPPALRADIRAIADDLQNGNRSDIETVGTVAAFRESFGL